MSGMDTSIAYDVVLLPDADRAVAYRKRAADSGCSLMGVTVAAFGAWVRDLWELYGDGRMFVSRLEREALLRAACERAADGCVDPESGERAQLADDASRRKVASQMAPARWSEMAMRGRSGSIALRPLALRPASACPPSMPRCAMRARACRRVSARLRA